MSSIRPIANRLIFVLATVGMFVAGYLWYLHASHKDIPCGVSRGCEIVAASAYAHFPEGNGPLVAAWGTLSYFGFTVLSFARTMVTSPRQDRLLLGLVALGAIVGTLFSLRLTYIELFVIHAICKWCVASQIIIILLASVSVAEWFAGSRTIPSTKTHDSNL